MKLRTRQGQRHNLAAIELSDPGSRSGGIATIDLSPRPGELDHVVRQASLGGGRFSLAEAGLDHAIVASTNPSEYWFYSGTAKMRFRAFKKNYLVGWKMGADIETWGGDFTRAEIQSDYGYPAWDNVCAVAHTLLAHRSRPGVRCGQRRGATGATGLLPYAQDGGTRGSVRFCQDLPGGR